MRAIDALGPKRQPAPRCSGLAASWCPIHGDCTCPDPGELPGDGPTLNDPGCPLHAPDSTHAA